MPDFVYDNGTLAGNKVDLTDPPEGANPQNYCISSEWNALCQAVIDVRTAVLSGKYHGLALQDNGYVPPGTAYRIWARQNGKLLAKNGASPEVELLTAARAITAGTGLTGGGPLTEDRTLSLANLSPSPAGTFRIGSYESALSMTVNARGQVSSVTTGPYAPEAWQYDHFDYLNTGRWTVTESSSGLVLVSNGVDDLDPAAWKAGGWLALQTNGDAMDISSIKSSAVYLCKTGLTLRGKVSPRDLYDSWWRLGFFSGDQKKAVYVGTDTDTWTSISLVTKSDNDHVTETLSKIEVSQINEALWFELEVLAGQVRLRLWLENPAKTETPYDQIVHSTNLPSDTAPLQLLASAQAFSSVPVALYIDYLWWKQ